VDVAEVLDYLLLNRAVAHQSSSQGSRTTLMAPSSFF
jgi:hypothetical protein